MRLCAVFLLLAAASFGQALASWSFNESDGATTLDSVSASRDAITGFHKFVAGVSGRALQFDGYTTQIVRPFKQAPVPVREFSIEAWVALDAYPWNWVPVVDHELDNQSGYLFGIDPYGHIGLHAASGGAWQILTSQAKVPLKRWTHIAATFHADRGLALYINGQPAGQLAARGPLDPPERTDLIIGRVRAPMMPVPSGLIHPKHPIWYSLEGALDELTIHGRSLDAKEIARDFAAVNAPEGMSSPWAVMPAGPPGPGKFGAYYATLRFQDTWDRPRRIGDDAEVVVRFEQSPMRLVFWQGNNYVPAWVTEKGQWYTDEFLEAYGKPHCPDGEDCEPMSDKQSRYSHVRILESTDARAVVHWRYALSETDFYKGAYPDPLTGWFDWGDEYWTVYPDGVAVRKQVLWTSNFVPQDHEFQETIVLNGPGQWPEDNINLDAVTLANLKGETKTYSWAPKAPGTFDFPHGPDGFPEPDGANIQWINLKSAWKPFQIAPGDPVRFTAYNGEKTFSTFEWWNHWPVAQIPSSGRPALAPDRASHTSLSHIYWPVYEQTDRTITKLLMDGLTNKSAAELAPLAKSWLTPAPIEVSGVRSQGYDAAQRAYVLVGDGASKRATIEFKGSPESPLVNPAVVIRNWQGGTRVNGAKVRTGRVEKLEGTDFVIWVEGTSAGTVRIEVQP